MFLATIATEKNAIANGQQDEFVQALAEFEDRWNSGTADAARYLKEYLVFAATKR